MTSYTSVWAAIQKLLCLCASQHFKAYAETQVPMPYGQGGLALERDFRLQSAAVCL